MSEPTWEDPPPVMHHGRAKGRWKELAAQLREHPGKWACVLDAATWNQANGAYASLRKHGCMVSMRGTSLEARVNMSPTIQVYAKWPEEAA